MGHLELEVACPVPIEEAWAAVADVAALDAWWPGVEACTVTGTRRSCTVTGGITIEEEIRSVDPQVLRVEYGIVEAPMAIEHHHAVLQVLHDAASDGSVLRFTVDVEPEEVATAMLPGMAPALESLRDYAVRRSNGAADQNGSG